MATEKGTSAKPTGGKKGGAKVFKPIKWDDTPPPQAPAGTWTAKIKSVRVQPTDDGSGVRIFPALKLMKTDDEELESFLNQTIDDRILIASTGKYPSVQQERMNKEQMRALRKATGTDDEDLLPKDIKSEKDLRPFIKALIAAPPFQIETRVSESNGRTFVNIAYVLDDSLDEDEDEDTEEGEDEEETEEEDEETEDTDEDEEEEEGEDEDDEEEEDEEPAAKKPAKKKPKAA